MRRKRATGYGQSTGLICLTGGVDVGATSIKTALLEHALDGDKVIAANLTLVRGSREPADLRTALRFSWASVLASAGVSDADVAYVASTGTHDQLAFRVGHFLGRSCQGIGTRFLFPHAIGYLDWGAGQLRGTILDDAGYIIRHVARRPNSDAARAAAWVAALLAETAPDSSIALVGGRTLDPALRAPFESKLRTLCPDARLLSSDQGRFVGAFGAALVAARRFRRLSGRSIAARRTQPSSYLPWLN